MRKKILKTRPNTYSFCITKTCITWHFCECHLFVTLMPNFVRSLFSVCLSLSIHCCLWISRYASMGADLNHLFYIGCARRPLKMCALFILCGIIYFTVFSLMLFFRYSWVLHIVYTRLGTEIYCEWNVKNAIYFCVISERFIL